MAARIALLIMTTGLFVAAWSGDHSPLAMAARSPQPERPSRYPDEAIRETVLHRWQQRTAAGQEVSRVNTFVPLADRTDVADACDALRAAHSMNDVSVRIDWLGIAENLQNQAVSFNRTARPQPLWHRLTLPVAKLIAAQARPGDSAIAVEPGDAVRE